MKLGELGENQIFIICTAKTGSTLLQQILASHSEIHTLASPWIINNLAYGLRHDNGLKPLGIETEYDAALANINLTNFLQKLPGGISVYYEAIRKAALFMYEKAMEGTKKKYFVDKSIRYYFIIPELFKIFPKAKFIFILRNPIAQFAGIMRKWIKDGNWMPLREFRPDFLKAHAYILDGIKKYGDQAAVVRYEELVVDPKKVIKQLCDKINIEFEEDMINYGKRTKSMSGFDIAGMGDPSTLCKYGEPVTDYINNWLKRLDTPQKVYFARSYLRTLGRETIEELGYSYDVISEQIDSITTDKNDILVPWDLIADEVLSDAKIKEQKENERKINGEATEITKKKELTNKIINSKILGKWEIQYGYFVGFRHTFYPDGTFERLHIRGNTKATGTYEVDESKRPHHIDFHVKEHSYGKAFLGTWLGIFEIENNILKMRFNQPNKPRWTDPDGYQYYRSID